MYFNYRIVTVMVEYDDDNDDSSLVSVDFFVVSFLFFPFLLHMHSLAPRGNVINTCLCRACTRE